jgi:sugar (pentulose or hexulose) kinase
LAADRYCSHRRDVPGEGLFSDLSGRLGIAGKLAPVRKPSDLLGFTTKDVSTRIGLSHPVPVQCGIHDSNASLLPHLIQQVPPFAVVSTGTWVVLFAVGGDLDHLDPARDTLANVDAFGRAVPSARFMGGREFELLTGGKGTATPEAINRVVEERILLTPSIVEGCGPYPHATHRVVNAPEGLTANEIYVGASFYAALMTKACLSLTGAAGPIVVEGPFARNRLYIEALSKVMARPVIPIAGSTGTSVGAALLTAPLSAPAAAQIETAPATADLPESFRQYCADWEKSVLAAEHIY